MHKLLLNGFLICSFLWAENNAKTTVPNLVIELLDGKRSTLDELVKKGPVFVDFWATWCAPCKKELVHVNRFQQIYADSGLTILAMSVDDTRSLSKVKSFIHAKKYNFLVGLDPKKEIAEKLNALLMPTSMILNEKREVVWFHQGYIPGDEVKMEEEITKALKTHKHSKDK